MRDAARPGPASLPVRRDETCGVATLSNVIVTQTPSLHTTSMSVNLNDAAMAGNVEEVLIRLNLGEDVNQKCYPR